MHYFLLVYFNNIFTGLFQFFSIYHKQCKQKNKKKELYVGLTVPVSMEADMGQTSCVQLFSNPSNEGKANLAEKGK